MSPRAVLTPTIGDQVLFDRQRYVIRGVANDVYSGPKALCSTDDGETATFHIPDMRWDNRRGVWRLPA